MTKLLTIADLTGDLVLYRDLQPCEPGLPGLAELRATLGLARNALPRKRDRDGARVILAVARQAQARRSPLPLRQMLVIGDTDNDRALASHLHTVSDTAVRAFIGADQLAAPATLTWEGDTALANRWALLTTWLAEVERRGPADAQTVLLLDIDKTLLGPRGRNDAAIDEARAEGALDVATAVLGDKLDNEGFRTYYATLCRKEYHGLTLDNQDYVVYIALALSSGALTLDELRAGMADGSLGSFRALLDTIAAQTPLEMNALHTTVSAADAAGDPTPFKAFRHAEFAATVARMADGRLTLCRELVELTRELAGRGVLCMAVSDKPAEASLPTPEQAAMGLPPLHRMPAPLA